MAQNIKVTNICDSCQEVEHATDWHEMKRDWFTVNVTVTSTKAKVKFYRQTSGLVCDSCKLILVNETPPSLSFFEKAKALFTRGKIRRKNS